MTRHTQKVSAVRLLGLSGAALLAAGSVGTAHAQIANSKHNLGNSQTAVGGNKTTATAEICVFCHTPHAGSSNTTAPLWNKNIGAGTGFTVYTSQSMDSTTQAPGAASLTCLSCHDGTQAMDAVINSPGSGLGSGALGGVWSGTFQTAGKMSGTTIALIGTDLRNDHPIGINYCGASATVVTGSIAACLDQDFKSVQNTGGFTWLETNANTTRQKTDLPLFAGAVGTQTVQCATCHDPHQTATGGTFLRISNASSAVCVACHAK